MQITQDNRTFRPVTIVLEAEEELDKLLNVLNKARKGSPSSKQFDFCINLIEELETATMNRD